MAADTVGPDPKALWKQLDVEAESPSLDRIHSLVRRYDSRLRLSVGLMAGLLLMVGLQGGQAWVKAHDPIMRVWAILFVFGEVGVCVLVYRLVFPQRDPAEPAGAFLRRRLQIRLGYAQGRWLLAISPLVPFMALSIYIDLTRRQGPWWARLTTATIFATAIVLSFVRSRVRARKLRAQIQELDQLLGA